MPKVSVIIPSHNPPREHIHECLESILNQQFKDFEILVIDDGSTIDSQSILAPYRNKIRYFYQENASPNAARNHGLKEAQGKYVALIDQDDLWLTHKLQEQVAFLDSHPEVDLIFSDFQNFNKQGFIGEPFLLLNKAIKTVACRQASGNSAYKIIADKNITCKFLKGDFIIQCTAMIRTDVCKKFNIFSTKNQMRTFYDFFTSNIHLLSIGYTDEVLAHRRMHGNNITLDSRRILEETMVIYQTAMTYSWMDEQCRAFLKKAMHESRYTLGKYFFVKGEYQKARVELKAAVKMDVLGFSALVLFCLSFIIPQKLLLNIKLMKKTLVKN